MNQVMNRLSGKEEEVMEQFWQRGPLFVNDILNGLDAGAKPHYNTISTIVKRLEEKGYVGHEQFGNTYRYFPLVSRDQFREASLQNIVSKYFDHSYVSVLSMFMKERKITPEQVRELFEQVGQGQAEAGDKKKKK